MKVFRRFRISSIINQKFSDYLKYAVGEVLLVVIGILIALSINNWNAKAVLHKEEAQVLEKIHTGLKQDLADINWCIDYHQEKLGSDSTLLNYLSEKEDASAEAIANILYTYLVSSSHLTLSFSAFEQLKTRDPKLISNDSLFSEISELYVVYYPLIIDMENYEEQYQIEDQMDPYLSKHLSIDKSTRATIVKNTGALKNDQAFELSLTVAIGNRIHLLETHQQTLDKVNRLIFNIEKNLNRKD